MITVEPECVKEIREHAVRDYPYECCGLLLGSFGPDGSKAVVEVYPISNAREEQAKRNRFLIKPEEVLRGERYAAKNKVEIVGFYHSHPNSPALPSQYDLEHAWPTYSYIIVSSSKGDSGELRSWEQRSDRSKFDEEEIVFGFKSSDL